jgi:hypothetical protein
MGPARCDTQCDGVRQLSRLRTKIDEYAAKRERSHRHAPYVPSALPRLSLRLGRTSRVYQPGERIEGASPRITLHSLLKQPARLFLCRCVAPLGPTSARPTVRRPRRVGEGEPNTLWWRDEAGWWGGEDCGGDPGGSDVR